jgi:hypothetical protein
MSDQSQEIIVAVDLDRSPDIVERLRDAGMDVAQVLHETRTVLGSAPRARIADIERLEGVVAVDAPRRFSVPPPDSPLQ